MPAVNGQFPTPPADTGVRSMELAGSIVYYGDRTARLVVYPSGSLVTTPALDTDSVQLMPS